MRAKIVSPNTVKYPCHLAFPLIMVVTAHIQYFCIFPFIKESPHCSSFPAHYKACILLFLFELDPLLYEELSV